MYYDDYTLERLAHSRLQDAQALATRARLAAAVRPARPPWPGRLVRALRLLVTGLLGGSPHAASQRG
jgi:hypothetical protein